MNKYIKLLIESFFDDVENDISDINNTLSDINISTSIDNLKLSDCKTLDDIFSYIIVKSKFGEFINEYKYTLVLDLTNKSSIPLYQISNTNITGLPDIFKVINNSEFTIYISAENIYLKLFESKESKPTLSFNANFTISSSVLYIQIWGGSKGFKYPLAKFEKDNIVYYDFDENNLKDVFLYYYTQYKVSSFHIYVNNILKENKFLSESFFDDINDDIFDINTQLSNINQKTALKYIKLEDCKDVDDIFNFIINNFNIPKLFNDIVQYLILTNEILYNTVMVLPKSNIDKQNYISTNFFDIKIHPTTFIISFFNERFSGSFRVIDNDVYILFPTLHKIKIILNIKDPQIIEYSESMFKETLQIIYNSYSSFKRHINTIILDNISKNK